MEPRATPTTELQKKAFLAKAYRTFVDRWESRGRPRKRCEGCGAALPHYELCCLVCGSRYILTFAGTMLSQEVLDLAKSLHPEEDAIMREPEPDDVMCYEPEPDDEIPFDDEGLYEAQTEAVKGLARQGLDIMEGKAHDYASPDNRWSAFELVGDIVDRAVASGVSGPFLVGITMIATKLARLTALLGEKGDNVVNESVEDTCVDLSNYALIIGAMLTTRRSTG